MSKKVLLATVKPFSQNARDQVTALVEKAGYEARVLEAYKDKSELLKAVADVDALIVRSDKIDSEVLEAAKELKLVVRAGAGYDNVDCEMAKKRGVSVMNTPGQNANAVAELAAGMMVYMARGQFNGKPGTELKGKRLGLLAIGAVGRAVTAIAKGFGMSIRAYDKFVEDSQIKDMGVEPKASPEELFKDSDYLSLHIPATAETRGSIGRELISLMPPNATLVNTARAEVINEVELVEMMGERDDIRYVTDIAPSGDIDTVLKEKYSSRYYATPKKMGAQTEEANVNAGTAAARQIIGFFEENIRKFIVNA
jgi:D-3-phosphoglycerate dehydrogenase / 2-oxoglutarate reductase